MTLPDAIPVAWGRSHRIIRTLYPPIDLFEDLADPSDWALILAAEAKTNPRVRDAAGDIALVPPERRVVDPGASWVMAPFTHASTDRPSRFSDGRHGVYYCGDRGEVALAETAFHFARFMAATAEPPGEADYRELVAGIAATLVDLRGGARPDCLDPEDWSAGQALGRAVRRANGDGVVYPSVRWPAGQAAALFWPDLVRPPITQARQFRYHWDGTRMDRWFVHGERAWRAWPMAA